MAGSTLREPPAQTTGGVGTAGTGRCQATPAPTKQVAATYDVCKGPVAYGDVAELADIELNLADVHDDAATAAGLARLADIHLQLWAKTSRKSNRVQRLPHFLTADMPIGRPQISAMLMQPVPRRPNRRTRQFALTLQRATLRVIAGVPYVAPASRHTLCARRGRDRIRADGGCVGGWRQGDERGDGAHDLPCS